MLKTNMKFLIVLQFAVLSSCGVFGENVTTDVKNELLLKSLASYKECEEETDTRSPDGSSNVTTGGFFRNVSGPVSGQNLTLASIRLSNILEAKQLLKFMGLSSKAKNLETNTRRTTRMKQNSTKDMEIDGEQTTPKGVNEASASSMEVNGNLARMVNVNLISEKANARSSAPRDMQYAVKDAKLFDEKADHEIRVYKKLLNLALNYINDASIESKARIHTAVQKSKESSTRTMEIAGNSAKAKQLKGKSEETKKGSGKTIKVKKGANGNATSSMEVVGNPVRLTEVNGQFANTTGTKPCNYSVNDSTQCVEKARQQVRLTKQLLGLALKHINSANTNSGCTQKVVQNSNGEVNKRYIDTIASGLIGRK